MIGYTPRDIDAMSLAEFKACIEGWVAANSPDGGGNAPSPEEFEAAKAAHGDA